MNDVQANTDQKTTTSLTVQSYADYACSEYMPLEGKTGGRLISLQKFPRYLIQTLRTSIKWMPIIWRMNLVSYAALTKNNMTQYLCHRLSARHIQQVPRPSLWSSHGARCTEGSPKPSRTVAECDCPLSSACAHRQKRLPSWLCTELKHFSYNGLLRESRDLRL